MSWLKAALRELLSLFVDDVWFTVAIVIWIALGTIQLPKLPVEPSWDAPLLFLGCAIILAVSVWRAARSHALKS